MKTTPDMFLDVCGGNSALATKVSEVANKGDMLGAMQMAQQGFVPAAKQERPEMTDDDHEEMVREMRAYDQECRDRIAPAVKKWLSEKDNHPELVDIDLLDIPEEVLFNATGKAVAISECHLISFKRDGQYRLTRSSTGHANHDKHDASLKGTRWG